MSAQDSEAPVKAAGGRREQERSLRSREAIMQAAIDLFAARGFEGVRLDDIAARSKKQRTLILYHFNSKEELWTAAATRVLDRFNKEMENRLLALDGLEGPALRKQLVESCFEGFLVEPEAAKFLVREGGTPSERLDWIVDRFGLPGFTLPNSRNFNTADPFTTSSVLLMSVAYVALLPLLEAKIGTRIEDRSDKPFSVAEHQHLMVDVITRIASVPTPPDA